ncbi:hypothetical protein ACWEWI_31640 [Streptomyces sp. NPDC003753]|uniref:hypothetical protein n=1 Tax=unclassified Streptomyces TaxID=2593676 RepID=UPI001905B8B9|nr:hypothetical protein [Streptomyces sp. Y2F8-2]GHK03863.1 hypothetical protein SY2F82_56600 [Streptomyces sp. Y2F8-2]GHK04861.1 hypothetical protein SY2F82_66580 [Streptomyces sp. Y2F8-2]
MKSQLSGIERHEDRMGYRRIFSVPAGRPIGPRGRLRLTHDSWMSTAVCSPAPAGFPSRTTRLRVAHQVLICDASRNNPAGCPGN